MIRAILQTQLRKTLQEHLEKYLAFFSLCRVEQGVELPRNERVSEGIDPYRLLTHPSGVQQPLRC